MTTENKNINENESGSFDSNTDDTNVTKRKKWKKPIGERIRYTGQTVNGYVYGHKVDDPEPESE